MYGNKLNQWDSTCSGILEDSLTICDQGYIYLNFSFNIFEIIKHLESVEGTSFLMRYPLNLSVIIVF